MSGSGEQKQGQEAAAGGVSTECRRWGKACSNEDWPRCRTLIRRGKIEDIRDTSEAFTHAMMIIDAVISYPATAPLMRRQAVASEGTG